MALFNRIAGQKIMLIGVENDDLVIEVEDGTRICLWSDEDLSISYEIGERKH